MQSLAQQNLQPSTSTQQKPSLVEQESPTLEEMNTALTYVNCSFTPESYSSFITQGTLDGQQIPEILWYFQKNARPFDITDPQDILIIETYHLIMESMGAYCPEHAAKKEIVYRR